MKKIIFLLLFFALVGGLGLKTRGDCDSPRQECRGTGANRADCQGARAFLDTGEKMLCYHEAAITQAIVCGGNTGCANLAADLCVEIPHIAGPGKQNIGESQMNYCLTDVAKYTKNDAVCDRISQGSSALDFLKGADTSKEVCKTAVARLRRTDPNRYLDNATDNLCALSFIFPPLLYLAMLRRKS